MVLDPPTSEDEPTNIVETKEEFARKKTSLSLEALPQTPRTQPTPKVHELNSLLREAQNQRLGALRSHADKKLTMVSGAKDEEPLARAAQEGVAGARRAAQEEERRVGGGAPRWLSIVVLLVQLAAASLVLWFLATGAVGGSGEGMTLDLQIQPPNAKVDVGGTPLANPGVHELSCDGGRMLTLSAPGYVTERHHLRCGDHLMLRLHLLPLGPSGP